MVLKHETLTEKIITVFYRVYNKLGYGFLEKVYEKAMMIELQKEGIQAVSQRAIEVMYDGSCIGEYYADILVDSKVIIEIKASKQLAVQHEAQLLNYLKATSAEVGLLLNFGPRPGVRRRVFENSRK